MRSSIVDSVSSLSEALSESGLEAGDLTDEVSDGVREGLLGTVVRGGLDPQNKLVLQRMRHLVASKQYLWVPQ